MALNPEKLASVPLFESLPEDSRRMFATWVSELKVPAGKHLAEEGDYAYELYIIEEGTAEVTHAGEVITELGPGEFFGEMGVLERAQRNATVIAKTDMTLLTLSHWDVKRLAKEAPGAVDEIRAVIEKRRQASS
ncbi:MAG: family transcriptional regulator, cyclic receptor protein [Thermoleophilaceae bacterium]|jgi:CRP-like cAMP-binding protein|nr:family transcriptional regulator, cyclic receptor protein [Thermoleophilaceae bacterium]